MPFSPSLPDYLILHGAYLGTQGRTPPELGGEATPKFWEIGRGRIETVVDLLTLEELETVVQGLELIRKAEEIASA